MKFDSFLNIFIAKRVKIDEKCQFFALLILYINSNALTRIAPGLRRTLGASSVAVVQTTPARMSAAFPRRMASSPASVEKCAAPAGAVSTVPLVVLWDVAPLVPRPQ